MAYGTDENGNPLYTYQHHFDTTSAGETNIGAFADPITLADQGALISWVDVTRPTYTYSHDWDDRGTSTEHSGDPVSTTYTSKLTTITNGQLGTTATLQLDPSDQGALIQPYLQREDGDYFGWSDVLNKLICFNTAGQVRWTKYVANGAEPQYALADGGMIYKEGTYYGAEPQIVTLTSDGEESTREPDRAETASWTGEIFTKSSDESQATTGFARTTQPLPWQPVLSQTTPNGAASVKRNPKSLSPTYAAGKNGNPSAPGTSVLSLGAIYARKVAELATSYIGSDRWVDDDRAVCNIFVANVLDEASAATQLDELHPERPIRYVAGLIPRHDACLASDWSQGDKTGKCWKRVSEGPDGAVPGDILATGPTSDNRNGTGHVGIVINAPPNEVLNRRLVSAAAGPPYYWPTNLQQTFRKGTVTLSDYGFRLPGYDPSHPEKMEGLKVDSTVKRFSCY